MKHLIFLALALFASTLFAQNTNDVTLTVVGSGKTIEEAKTNALRSAIEQAYGAFVSSNTEILNDEIVKDEIVSISSGNIKEYKILSQSELLNDLVSMTLSATVSVSKLQSYAQSKGASIEFAGGAFAMNMKLQKLNEDAETAAIKNLCAVLDELYKKCFDFKIKASEPLFVAEDRYKIEYKITSTSNSNYQAIIELIYSTLKDISMSDREMDSYTAAGKKVYLIGWFKNEFENPHSWYNDPSHKFGYSTSKSYGHQLVGVKEAYALRSLESIALLRNHFISSNRAPFLFSINANGETHLMPLLDEKHYEINLIRTPELALSKPIIHRILQNNTKSIWSINDELSSNISNHPRDKGKSPLKLGFPDARMIDYGKKEVRTIGRVNFLEGYSAAPLWSDFIHSTEDCKNVKDCKIQPDKQWLEKINYSSNSAESHIYSTIISDKSRYTFTSTCVEFLTLSELEKISEITVEPIYK